MINEDKKVRGGARSTSAHGALMDSPWCCTGESPAYVWNAAMYTVPKRVVNAETCAVVKICQSDDHTIAISRMI